MSNIRLLEAYLRRDFKDIVNDMNKITLLILMIKQEEEFKKN
jgi:hypothetical protein